MNFEELCGTAISRFSLCINDFYDLTPVEFKQANLQRNKKELDEFKVQYEVARFIVKHLWNMQGRVLKKMVKDEKEVESFSWETQKEQTVEDMKRTVLNIAESFKHLKKKEKKT